MLNRTTLGTVEHALCCRGDNRCQRGADRPKPGAWANLAYHRASDVTTPDHGKQETDFVGGVYGFGAARLHAGYARNKGEDAAGTDTVDSNDFMVDVTVPFGAHTFLASYNQRKNDLIDNIDSKQYAIGNTCALSKRTNFYASYAKIRNQANAAKGFAASVKGVPVVGDDPSLLAAGTCHTF